MASVVHQLKTSASLFQRKGLLSPLLIFLMLMLLLVGQSASALSAFSQEALAWRLGVAAVVYWLLFSAFTAGWFHMIAVAVAQEFGPTGLNVVSPAARALNTPAAEAPPVEPTRAAQALDVIKAFLPGVGEFFVPVALGWLFTLLGVGLALVLAHQHVVTHGDYPYALLNDLMRMAQDGRQTQASLQAFLMARPPADILHLSSVMSVYAAVLAGCYLCGWVTAFWAPLVVLGRRSVGRAFVESVTLFFRRGIALLAVALTLGLTGMALLLISPIHPIMEVVAIFLLLALKTIALTFLFVHVYEALRTHEARTRPGEQTIAVSAANSSTS